MDAINSESGTSLWHPFADMAAVQSSEFCLAGANGVWVEDSRGNKYLDGSASLWYANLGHGRTEIVEAASRQMGTLDAYSIFGDYANEPAVDLASVLSDLAPGRDAKVFLTLGGGESIETAAKLARAYWRVCGRAEKVHVISRTSSYHGTQGFGTSIGGMPPVAEGFGPLVADTSRVPFDSVEALEDRIRDLDGTAAAFFCEPVLGAGGVHHPPPGYIEAAAAICSQHDVLFVVDAVICGFGRLGTWFAAERFGVVPDMITFAKGVSSGYLPIGGVIVSAEVAAPFWAEPGGPTFNHGATYAGHPACCAAALKAIEIYERDGLIPRGAELEGVLDQALAPLREDDRVADVRSGLGLMAAVDLNAEMVAEIGGGTAFQLAVRKEGMLVRALPAGIAIAPPLTITEAEIGRLGEIVAAAIDELERSAASR